MNTIVRISEAAVIALHAADYLAANSGAARSNAEIARALGVSVNHLSKVMQGLARAGVVSPRRGPGGGFRLAEKAGGITLREIVESVEGKLHFAPCFMDNGVCGRRGCAFGSFLRETNARFAKMLSKKLSEFAAEPRGRGNNI